MSKTATQKTIDDTMTASTTTKPCRKKVLITGSSGYVGQYLIASLLLGGAGSSLDHRDGDVESGAPRAKTKEIGDVDGDVVVEGEKEVQYELFCAYNSLSTFEKDLDAMLRSHQQQPLSSSTAHPRRPRVSVHLIPNVDFSQPNYIDLIQRAIADVSHESTFNNNQSSLDAIVHLAALSSPGYCEQNVSLSYQVNCPIELLKFNAPIIYLSTDQVYEGTKQYYEEYKDETVPVNVYGWSKLAFERVLLGGCGAQEHTRPLLTSKEMGANDSCRRNLQGITMDRTIPIAHPNSIVLRSSLILGPPPPFANGCKKGACPTFLQFIESRFRSSTPTEYFVNEYRSVVHIHDVIKAIHHFLEKVITSTSSIQESTVRIYNLGGSARVSRYDIALEVARQLNVDSSSAKAVIRTIGGHGGVPSPPDISMNVEKITRELNVKMKGLKEIVTSTFA